MSAASRDDDDLVDKIALVVTGMAQDIRKLQAALADHAEMKLEIAELQADVDIAKCKQDEINQALAARMGGILVRAEPERPARSRPRLVVDNAVERDVRNSGVEPEITEPEKPEIMETERGGRAMAIYTVTIAEVGSIIESVAGRVDQLTMLAPPSGGHEETHMHPHTGLPMTGMFALVDQSPTGDRLLLGHDMGGIGRDRPFLTNGNLTFTQLRLQSMPRNCSVEIVTA
jgi:hypothetical protein